MDFRDREAVSQSVHQLREIENFSSPLIAPKHCLPANTFRFQNFIQSPVGPGQSKLKLKRA